MKHYVYYLRDPNGSIRYVGLTCDPERRRWEHQACDAGRVVGERYAAWKDTWTTYPTMDVVCVLQTLEEGRRVEAALVVRLRARGVDLVNGDEDERREKIRQSNYLRTNEFKTNVGRIVSKALQALPVEKRAGGARTLEGIEAHNAACRKAWTPEKRAAFGEQQRERIALKQSQKRG